MTTTTVVRPADPTLRPALQLAFVFGAIKLLLHFALTLYTQHLGYGYFRDEFYYIACGRHLAWGYVDHGPIVAVQARLGEVLFGDSLFAIRIFSALAGAIMVFLGGLVAWSLGGKRPAQALTMIGLLVAPQYIGADGFLSMNSCEAMFWTTCLLAIIMLARDASAPRWWTIFGISAGIGLLNKPSMLFFLVALGIGLLLTKQRRLLFTRWAALGIALLILIALPFVFWQIHNHWPTLEFLHNGKVGHKNTILNPLQFFLAQFANMHPLNALLWITGIVALLRAKSIRSSQWLGLTYLFFFAAMLAMHAKDYYLEGIYPALFAAGAISWEHRFAASRAVKQGRIFAFPIYESLLILTGLIILPLASPVLRPATWVSYTKALHLQPGKTETDAIGPLPQFYADRFGWQQEADIVVKTFRSLSPEDQKQVCLFGSNYGEAGAIDFLAHREEPRLPPAISGHNTYWIWGPHGCTGHILISVVGGSPAELQQIYNGVQTVGTMDDPYAMPFEHRNIYLLHDRKENLQKEWPDFKNYF